ncbi:MAG: hypothetical protein ACPGUV_15060 [Polyangiales bacterium]
MRRLLGACFYNLGRILETQKRVYDAALCYERSLAFRPHRTVAARRRSLARHSDVRRDFGLRALPEGLRTKACLLRADACCPSGVFDEDGCHLALDETLQTGDAQISQVVVLFTGRDGEQRWGDYHLAIESVDGWHIERDIPALDDPNGFGGSEELRFRLGLRPGLS